MIKRFLGLLLIGSLFLGACAKKETRTLKEVEDQEIKDFLSRNNLSSQFKKDSSGFYYQVLNEGNTQLDSLRYPEKITFWYNTTSINKSVNIDVSIYSQSTTFLGYITPIAWREALKNIRKGGSIRIITPSYLAYGKSGSGLSIPGNSILDTKIEVADNSDQTVYEDWLIRKYATENNLTLQKDESGIYYQISETGTGTSPVLSSNVRYNYTGKLLTGRIFDQNTSELGSSSKLSDLIEGWKIILPKLKTGGKVRMLLPSRYAYGSQPDRNGIIPPNSILDFEVTLLKVD